MVALMASDLLLLPSDQVDVGTQRCRLGPGVMSQMDLRLGSPVLVKLPGGASCLCTAWPRPDLSDAYLQLDLTCCSPGVDRRSLSQVRIGLGDVKPVTRVRLRRVRVNVMVQGGKIKHGPSAGAVQDLVKGLLTGMYVHEKHLVELSAPGAHIRCLEVVNVNSGSHKAGQVTPETQVEVASVQTVEAYQRWVREGPGIPLGGLEEVCASLKEMLMLALKYPATTRTLGHVLGRGVLLVGPPGTGKTQLVRSVASKVRAALVTVSGPVIVGSRPGESEENLRVAFREAAEAGQDDPCILFIDEIDALCPRRSQSGSGPENRLVAQLLTLMDGIGSDKGFVVIGATNRPDALDPALRRPGRFDKELVVGVPTLQQRYRILKCVCGAVPLSGVDLHAIAERTSGYVGADLSAVCREATLQAILHTAQHEPGDPGKSEPQVAAVREEHFLKALRLVPPSCLRNSVGVAEFKPLSWEQIGGLDKVKLKLKQSVEWPMKFPEAFVRMGVVRARGVLLYGPPGCAKTTLVKAAASSAHCSFLTLSGAEIYSPYIGDSEKALAQLFRQARACSPSIVFLDEIESLVGCRGNSDGGVQSQVLAVLLNELDGVGFKTSERRGSENTTSQRGGEKQKQMELQELCNQDVMIVAATNRPDMLDSALLRPGRFDHIIYVPPPDLQARLAILQLHTGKMPLDTDVCLEDLATQTHLFSGADLESLCKEAALLALHEEGMCVSAVQQKHFLRVLQSFRPSLTPQQLHQYQRLFSGPESDVF